MVMKLVKMSLCCINYEIAHMEGSRLNSKGGFQTLKNLKWRLPIGGL